MQLARIPYLVCGASKLQLSHPLNQGLQTTARGPDAAREVVASGPRSHFVNEKK